MRGGYVVAGFVPEVGKAQEPEVRGEQRDEDAQADAGAGEAAGLAGWHQWFIWIRTDMAEREGFEPPIPVKVCPLSRRIVSTTHAPLRVGTCNRIQSSSFCAPLRSER